MNNQKAPAHGVANQLTAIVRDLVREDLTIQLRAWDGSEVGPAGGPTVVLRDPALVRRLLWQPGQLGLAQAYLAGEIDVEGDLTEALKRALSHGRRARATRPGVGPILRAFALVLRLGGIGRRPPVPLAPVRLSGAPHSRARDRAVVAHHYDLCNQFYQLILDPTMAYSCGYWTSQRPGYNLADAQRDKAELICHKLGLRPGLRLLDIGCGWGSLTRYAARERGVRVTAVTLSEQQRTYIAGLDLDESVTISLADYRDVDDGPYDAIACVEMGEHVGAGGYPAFAARLYSLLRPGGRLLIQQMSRRRGASAGGGAFIEAYVAADMHMRPVGETVALIEEAGLEVRDLQSMREHYVSTVAAWLATLEDRWADIVGLVGEPMARMWRLYLAGGALAFAERRMGLDQILAVRPAPDGTSGMPAVREDTVASVFGQEGAPVDQWHRYRVDSQISNTG